MKELTKRQREMLEMIIAYKTECGFYPSYRDLCEIFDISSTSGVGNHIKALEKKGYLQKTGLARSFIIKERQKMSKRAENKRKNIFSEPIQVEVGEWWFKGCFIQEQDHPDLLKYVIFADTKEQEHIDVCSTFAEAKAICRRNEVKDNLKSYQNLIYILR